MANNRESYSSDVRLELVSRSSRVRLAKIGPGYVVPRARVQLPAGDANVVLWIDGNERCWKVRLLGDSVPFERAVRFVDVSDETIPEAEDSTAPPGCLF